MVLLDGDAGICQHQRGWSRFDAENLDGQRAEEAYFYDPARDRPAATTPDLKAQIAGGRSIVLERDQLSESGGLERLLNAPVTVRGIDQRTPTDKAIFSSIETHSERLPSERNSLAFASESSSLLADSLRAFATESRVG
jgi:hypothetical protein